MTLRSRTAITVAALLALALPAWAGGGPQRALGSAGELFEVRSGTYGDLFPGGSEAAAGDPVLALEIVGSGQTGAERLLVPGTAGPEAENSPAIVVEKRSDSVYLVWESRSSYVHSKIRLIQYSGGEWSELITLLGSRFYLKSSPRLAVTRNSYEYTDESGQMVQGERTVFHTIWREETESGLSTVYAPVILLDGLYTGGTAYTDLNQFLPAEATGGGEVPEGLLYTASIQPGGDNQSVVVAFTDTVNGEVVTLSLGVLPTELSAIADGARAQIIEVGNRLGPGHRQALAGGARAQIIEVGNRLRAGGRMVEYLADEIRELIVSAPAEEQLTSLAGRARAQIIEVGATLDRGGVSRRSALASAFFMEVEQPELPAAELPVSGSHHFEVLVASRRPVPEIGAGATHLFVSDTGEDVLVAWEDGDYLRYRESAGDGWDEAQSLHLSEDLDLEQAEEILERRIRPH